MSSYTTNDLFSERLISAVCGAAIVLISESLYACMRLFKRRTTLFFFMAQLAIWASAMEIILGALIYYLPSFRILSILLLILILITIFALNMGYPIMMLLRLRLVRSFSIYIICIPVILAAIVTILSYFWVHTILINTENCFHIFHIIRPITTFILNVEFIIINLLFIMLAITYLENIVHTRCVVIVNIIVIAIQCTVVVIEFVFIKQCSVLIIVLCIQFIFDQIKIRLEIEILSYIIQSVNERHEQCINNEDLCNNLNFLEERYN